MMPCSLSRSRSLSRMGSVVQNRPTILSLALVAFLAVGLLIPSPGSGTAQAAAYDIDATHSSVGFQIRHMFSLVSGTFNEFSGVVDFDEAAPEKSKASITIQASSIDTRNAKRDGHLQSPDFFDVANHPTITFTSTRIEKTDRADLYKMHGDLTMHGVTKPVVLDVTILGSGPDGSGGVRAGFQLAGTIDRKDYGLTWNRALDNGGALLGDDVTLDVFIAAVNKRES